MPKTLLTQQFIRDHSLADLCERYQISARRHGKYPNLALLKYSQINSPMAEPIVQECRGLILDESDDWRVVSFPFRKFFNHGEGHAAPIDWTTAKVYEKLDGSLCTLYGYDGHWHVASSGLPDAAGGINGSSTTFAELFWQTWKDMGYAPPPESDQGAFCYMFELTTPLNRVVVPYDRSGLVLIGVRKLTHDEFAEVAHAEVADSFGWKSVKSFPLNSFDACLTAAKAIDPMKAEGYVVCDGNFNRVKIKAPAYVALAHLKEAMSGRRLLEVVRANEASEFLTYFPEWTEAYGRVRGAFDELCRVVETDYERLKSIPDQKTFAMEALKTRCSGALFSLRKGTCKSAREYFAEATLQTAERVIGIDLAVILPTANDEESPGVRSPKI